MGLARDGTKRGFEQRQEFVGQKISAVWPEGHEVGLRFLLGENLVVYGHEASVGVDEA